MPQKKFQNFKIILGDPCFPKSQVLVIPANSKGIMSHGILEKISQNTKNSVVKEAKEICNKQNIKIGEYFITDSGKLKRRGTKKIYHCVIKRFPSDYTSITVIEQALDNVLKAIVRNLEDEITVCGIGIDVGEIDKKSVARIFYKLCKKYDDNVNIKIIDNDKEFIEELNVLCEYDDFKSKTKKSGNI